MAAPRPPPGGAAGDPHERAKLALAVAGLVFLSLLGFVVINLLAAALAWLFTLWGLLAVLGMVTSLAFGLGYYMLTRNRPPPPLASMATTAERVETREI
jgi:hypothetical protein